MGARYLMTNPLHIVQGGIRNGDKRYLEKKSRDGSQSRPEWVAPKSAKIGDDVVVYVGGLGFFATAQIASTPKPRRDWKNRFGAALGSIKLIEPPISLGAIQKRIPNLRWALYPRSINTPPAKVAAQIRAVISRRRKRRGADINQATLSMANMAELRAAALSKASAKASAHVREKIERLRSKAIRFYVLARANGVCEGCANRAPFEGVDGSPFLEPHHTDRLADDGPDHPAHVIALCPNCHRCAHYSKDFKDFNSSLKRKLRKIERC
jgi:hypothetical protein